MLKGWSHDVAKLSCGASSGTGRALAGIAVCKIACPILSTPLEAEFWLLNVP
jgi:hypothetical protein